MTITNFIARCDAYCEAAGVSRVWLSKRLFNDTFRLEQLAAGRSDVGVMRLERAERDLAALAAVVGSHGDLSLVDEDVVAPGADDGAEKADANISRTGVAA